MSVSSLALLAFLAASPASPSANPTLAPASVQQPAVTVDAVQQATANLVATFQKVKRDDGSLSEQDKALNQKAFGALDELLDRDQFSDSVIAPRKDKLTSEELAEFRKLFWGVVQGSSYPGAGEFFRKNQTKAGTPTEQNGVWNHVLTATVESEGIETEIGLKWSRKGEVLKLVDVLFDGDSMVKDYQNQFARIVDKDGAKGLLKKLADRLSTLKKPSGSDK